MSIYTYQCINKNGETVNGRIDAVHEAEAYEKLKGMGLMLVDLREEKIGSAQKKLSFLEKKVGLTELSLFSRQLAAMLEAGIPVTRAIFTLSRQEPNRVLRQALENIASSVESGMNLTESMSQYPKIFNNLYLNMIHAGEISGTLEVTLNRLADQLKKEKLLKENIKSATSYPKMIGAFSVIIFFGMLIFLVPVFKNMITADTEVPYITKIVFSISDSLRNSFLMWLGVAVIFITLIFLITKSSSGNYVWERFKFKVPVIGKFIHKIVIARFLRTLSTLLEGGIPVIQALESAGPTSGSTLVSKAVEDAIIQIQEGKSIAATLEESGLFPPMVTHIISVGEETGSLPALLAKMAEFYEDEVEIMSRNLTAMIQPVMLILIGIIIGGMLIAMYLPMFSAIVSSEII